MRRLAILTALVAIALLAGCADQRRFHYSQVARLDMPGRPGVTYEQAFDVAAGVMNDFFGAVDKLDRRGGTIECRPSAYTPSRLEYTPSRMPLSAAQSRYRRVATMKVEARDGAVTAGLRVEVQREDTREYRQFARLRDPYDTEMDTPIDDAAEGGVENRVWTFVRYDDQAEREALADLADRLADLSGTPAASRPASP